MKEIKTKFIRNNIIKIYLCHGYNTIALTVTIIELLIVKNRHESLSILIGIVHH